MKRLPGPRIAGILRRLPRRRRRASGAPLMFKRTRLQLTLWYTGVLTAALVLFGAILYAVVHAALLHPIDQRLTQSARRLGIFWQTTEPAWSCPPYRFHARFGIAYWACFDGSGDLLGVSDRTMITPRFYDQALVAAALRTGAATATVSDASLSGAMALRAVAVAGTSGSGVLGVVVVGVPVQGTLDALDVLLTRLLALGLVILVAASLGGAFLARRALVPVRDAFERQQSFIAHASHELRTPLTLLRADAEVLLRSRDRFSPDDAELLEDIATEASHMGALAGSLLMLARLDAGQLQLERDLVDLAQVATTLARRTRAYAAGAGVDVRADVAAPVIVLGDCRLLEQTVLVLLDNAVKYSCPGGHVVLRAFPSPAAPGHACLEVRDTGIGIEAEHLPHLGERFYRVDKARSRETGGAGLGLSFAMGIARAHGGSLTVNSAPGIGTTATLTLPAMSRQPRC
jgi:signal transduction histidine kinase